MDMGIFSIGLSKKTFGEIPDVLFRNAFKHPNFTEVKIGNYEVSEVNTQKIMIDFNLPESEIKNVEEELKVFAGMSTYFKCPKITVVAMNIPKIPECISWEERYLLRALLGMNSPPYALNYPKLIDAIISPPLKLRDSSIWHG